MSKFVSLTCPNCGARLQRRPGAASAVCEYCGTEHIFGAEKPAPPAEFVPKRDWEVDAEDFTARQQPEEITRFCPVCHQGDQLLPLSQYISEARLNRRGGEVKHLLLPAEPVFTHAEPVRQPVPQIPMPPSPGVTGAQVLGFLVGLLAFYLLQWAFTIANGDLITFVCFGTPGFAATLLTIKLMRKPKTNQTIEDPLLSEKSDRQYRADKRDYRQYVDRFNKELNEYRAKEAVWNELYYCPPR